MKKNMRQIKLGKRGQSLVELALSMNLLLLLALGATDLGNYLYTYNRLLSATREGARVAAESGVNSYTTWGWGIVSYQSIMDSAKSRTQLVLSNSGIKWYDANLTVDAAYHDSDMYTPESDEYGWADCNILNVTASYKMKSFFGKALSLFNFNLPQTISATAGSAVYCGY